MTDFSVLIGYVYYDAESQSGLRFCKDGRVVGSLNSNGYYEFRYQKILFRNHRVITYLFGNNPEGRVVDHLNGNTTDNRIENLRVVNNAVNSRNRVTTKKSNTGILGITEYNGKFVVQYRSINSINKTKSFSIRTHGRKQALELAKRYRLSKIDELNNIGANYTERHGHG